MNAIMRSFVMGMLPGEVSRAQFPQAQKEPVAYLYNGVRLPKLPEWDKETYPYAWIYQAISSGTYYLRISDTPVVRRLYPDYGTASFYSSGTGCRFNNTNGKWEQFDIEWGEPFDNYFPESRYLTIWVNQDMLNSDGTVYLAASAPIPVYEKE